jgi:hypothetical protein
MFNEYVFVFEKSIFNGALSSIKDIVVVYTYLKRFQKSSIAQLFIVSCSTTEHS